MKKTIIFMYHNIETPPKGTSFRGLYVTPLMFRLQMCYLKTAGFKVVSLKEIISFIEGDASDENLAAITFDDGYQNIYDNAYPILKAYGYPATVFLVSELVGKENLWDQTKGEVRKKLLDWECILKLQAQGITFGSHSKTHLFLSTLSKQDMTSEIKDSKSFLEEKLQVPVDFFCYPYGDYDHAVLDVVREAGYIGAVTTKRGLVHKNDNPFEIRRSIIRKTTHPLLFMLRLHTNYEDRKVRAR